MTPKIIVTGGAGFIGANIVAALNERGIEDILVVDRLGTDEKWKNLRDLKFADYMDKDVFLDGVVSGKLAAPQCIFHMGACSATTEKDADYLMANNFEYSRQLALWASATGSRLILASSGATYGDGSLGYSDDDAVTPTLRPLNMYGYSKQLFDEWAFRNGLYNKIVGLKFFNVFGPRESHKADMRSVVHKAYHEIRASGQMSLFRSDRPEYRDGEQKRDFVYVKDAVAVSLFFMDHPEVSGLFNCGTGRAQTWLDLAGAIFKALELPMKINWVTMPPALQGKYQYFTQADSSKLMAAGYTTGFTSLDDAVKDYVGWIEANES